MSTEQAGAVVIQVTAEDFMRLCENSAPGDVTGQAGRFEVIDADAGDPDSPQKWHRAYWLGQNYAAVIFARAFLAARGFGYCVLFDTASDEPDGPMYGYVILTDYTADATGLEL
jgi:hypothetical protein